MECDKGRSLVNEKWLGFEEVEAENENILLMGSRERGYADTW